MASSFFSSLLIIFLLYISSRNSLTQSLTGVKLPLIHRLSLPEHSNETFQQLVETNLKQLEMEFSTLDAQVEFSTPMINFKIFIYFVNVTIGNPPVEQYLQVDTGSSLAWVRGHDPPRPYFYNPLKSDTFRQISCVDTICTSNSYIFMCLPEKTNLCGYRIFYGDGTSSSGRIGYDRFGFANYPEPNSHSFVDNVLFGSLGKIVDGVGTDDEHYYGILGLGPKNISLVNQLPGPKVFSYCVSNLSSADESQGYLHFGAVDDYTADLGTTPIIQDRYKQYIIEIQSICLDNACLAIDPSVFKRIPGVPLSGVLIDTGTIYSFLPDVAYGVLEDAVIKLMKSKNKTYVPEYYNRTKSRLCYDGKLDGDESSYPTLIINFVGGGGAKMEITRDEYLHEISTDLHCLSFLRSSRLGVVNTKFTILGLLSQQYHIFEFNLDDWTVAILSDTFCNGPIDPVGLELSL